MEKKEYYTYRAKYVQRSRDPEPGDTQYANIEEYLDSLATPKKKSTD